MVKKNIKSTKQSESSILDKMKSAEPISNKPIEVPVELDQSVSIATPPVMINNEIKPTKTIKVKKTKGNVESKLTPMETIPESSPINEPTPINEPSKKNIKLNIENTKKVKKNKQEINDNISIDSNQSNQSNITQPISPKKRGRKPKDKVGVIISNTIDNENDNIIIHLPIKSNNIKNSLNDNDIFKYNPIVSEPIGYSDNIAGSSVDQYQFISQKNNPNKDSELIGDGPKLNSTFCVYPFDEKEKDIFDVLDNEESNNLADTTDSIIPEIQKQIDSNIQIEHNQQWFKNNTVFNSPSECVAVSSDTNKKGFNQIMDQIKKQREIDFENMNIKQHKNTVEKCLIQFEEANKTNSYPNNTSIYCWWCCHPFNSTPCSLPHEYKNGTFFVSGIFCSPECATAYNFDDTNSGCDVWERYSLLNFMYRKIYNDKKIKIKSAAPRQTLKIFGGNLTIKEFRSHNSNYEMNYKIIMPPMTSIIPVQEISSLEKGYSSKNEKKMVLLEKDKISTSTLMESSSNLRLKRDKPLNNNNTLDKCMLNLNNSHASFDDTSFTSELC